jgi:NitT/TauT family transport system permease protein
MPCKKPNTMRRARQILGAASPWLVVIILLLAWQAATATGLADPRYISRPSTVAALAWEWTRSGFILRHITVTLTEVVVGYTAGTITGMLVAFGFFFFPRVAEICDPMVVVLNAAPRAILAPFAVLLFGIGLLSKMMLVLLAVFTITLLNLYTGLKEVDRTIVNNARVMGAGQRDLVRHVYIPAALVWIVSAMRISIGQAFTAAIVCELLGATEGIGWIVAAGQSAVKPDWIMAGLFFAAAIVVIADFLVLAPLERRGSHWRVF